jgi:hypothetical protein
MLLHFQNLFTYLYKNLFIYILYINNYDIKLVN